MVFDLGCIGKDPFAPFMGGLTFRGMQRSSLFPWALSPPRLGLGAAAVGSAAACGLGPGQWGVGRFRARILSCLGPQILVWFWVSLLFSAFLAFQPHLPLPQTLVLLRRSLVLSVFKDLACTRNTKFPTSTAFRRVAEGVRRIRVVVQTIPESPLSHKTETLSPFSAKLSTPLPPGSHHLSVCLQALGCSRYVTQAEPYGVCLSANGLFHSVWCP